MSTDDPGRMTDSALLCHIGEHIDASHDDRRKANALLRGPANESLTREERAWAESTVARLGPFRLRP